MKDSFTETEKQLIKIVHQFLHESGNERALSAVNIDAALEEDLGIGSLERTELFYRIEKAFTMQLPTSAMIEAKTLRHLVAFIHETNPKPLPHKYDQRSQLEAANVNPATATTLIEVLQQYVKYKPERPHIYLQDEQGNETTITYGQLFASATLVANGLVNRGIKPGETVAIMLPTSAEFFYSFFGILLAGAIPVPIYPPTRPDQIEEYARREAKILHNAEVRILITFQKAEMLSKILQTFIPSLKEVTTAAALADNKADLTGIIVESDDPALIQYTSGSTGDPKGVLLTHKNLLANIHAYGAAIDIKPTDVIVSWLPLYHDMGLIGCWLGSLYYGITLTLLSPMTFLTRPERWLWAIHNHRASLTAGPNFAYELCVRKIDDEALEGLDLSSWRLAFNGAEAIYAKTLRDFTKRFSKYGFKAQSFYPVYGLAENAVALTFPELNSLPRIDKIEREQFEKSCQAIPTTTNNKNYLEFVGCGKPLSNHEVRIVDKKNQILPERHVGSLQFRGPSSMQGYYRNPNATKAVYYDGWWDSGDFAYLADGEIFPTGRKKDIIIKAGRNIYPAEIEDLAMQVPGIRRGCVAAFGIIDPTRGTEKFIIIAETRETEKATRNLIIKKLNAVITNALNLPPDQIVLVAPGRIPKTSSGKLRRADCKRAYLNNQLNLQRAPFWVQMTKLSFSGFWKKIKRWTTKLSQALYTAYLGLLLLITVPLLWLYIHSFSTTRSAKMMRGWARFILLVAGCPTKIHGKENLYKHSPMIFAANHCSYIDAILLTAVLPAGIIFVGKQELEKAPIIRSFIKKLGHISVNRVDFSKSAQETTRIQAALHSGRSIVIFPEGTFAYATGLRPFKLGAFKVATESNKPICPIALQGTRKILRSGTWLFRPSAITVTVNTPIKPQSNDWQELIRLRDEVRTKIAKHCGEPTLDLVAATHVVE